MDYKIGDIAKLLNISRQMVRYYEECGVIAPKRQDGNNYRTYSIFDFFSIGEIMIYQKMGMNIKDSLSVTTENFDSQIIQVYRDHSEKLENSIRDFEIEKSRSDELIHEYELASLNEGMIWKRKVDQYCLYPYQEAHGDDYGKFYMTYDELSRFVNREISFYCDTVVRFDEDQETWCFNIKKKYRDYFNLASFQHEELQPEQICLCSVIDMGNPGEFNRNMIQPLMSYAQEHQLQICGAPYGVLRGRGMKDDTFHRHMEIRVPIENLKTV